MQPRDPRPHLYNQRIIYPSNPRAWARAVTGQRFQQSYYRCNNTCSSCTRRIQQIDEATLTAMKLIF